MSRIKRLIGTFVFAMVVLAGGRWVSAQDDRIFELRTYTTHEGRLEALNKRFREHTNRLFVKHSMGLIGYWMPAEGPGAGSTLIYILAYPSREAREASWQTFRDAPEWKRVAEESQRDGRIVVR